MKKYQLKEIIRELVETELFERNKENKAKKTPL